MPQLFVVKTSLLSQTNAIPECLCPRNNGIAEQCHHTVKRIAMRSRCSMAEAMYWYNVTPKDNETPSSMLANGICQYEQHVEGVDCKPSLPEDRSNIYQIGEPV